MSFPIDTLPEKHLILLFFHSMLFIKNCSQVFVHFEPLSPLDPNEPSRYDPGEDLPPYIIPRSKWEGKWRKDNPKGWKGVRF